jgi:hypothetical protein
MNAKLKTKKSYIEINDPNDLLSQFCNNVSRKQARANHKNIAR